LILLIECGRQLRAVDLGEMVNYFLFSKQQPAIIQKMLKTVYQSEI